MPRTVEPLTDTKIRNAKPRERSYKLFDGGGLYLEVMADGRKLWRFKYVRPSGAENRLGFGTYPGVTLAQARAQRDAARSHVADGKDPGAVKQDQRRAAKIAAGNSFEAVARDWHATQKESWSEVYAGKVIASLENDVFPVMGSTPIADIRAPAILDMLKKIEARGVRETTKRVLQRMRAVFQYGIVYGLCDRNPATDIDSDVVLKAAPVQHMARVTLGEMPQLLRDIDAYEGDKVTRLALQLMTLTFVRTTEMIQAQWCEIDEKKGEWLVPAERMKMRDPHVVPLSKQAVAVLKELREINGHRDYIFYSPRGKTGHISNNTMLYALYRMGYHSRMTGHGFRGLASTALNELGFRPDVIERQLAHVERNKVRAAYNHAQYLPERRQMMQAWANWLETTALKA
ncbi:MULTISPECIES: tyrosine-type recombinase/integrase [Cupriavidus]|jgi:integrase|uniref:tyrosine-type recombinase/integrase n=1 Tax=Cupriavidus TaxID=106589 RepID=UPI0005797675|nr:MULTISPECIES: integrase arm-type DNA-binding domain-containing protein [Cupriavidus]KWR80321.1 integrase [Cupriavidus sp. SHE]QWC87733.1 tyrosine-type recombinase/integrase [Cupriavidus metallidurans]